MGPDHRRRTGPVPVDTAKLGVRGEPRSRRRARDLGRCWSHPSLATGKQAGPGLRSCAQTPRTAWIGTFAGASEIDVVRRPPLLAHLQRRAGRELGQELGFGSASSSSSVAERLRSVHVGARPRLTSAVGPCSPPSPKRTRGSRTKVSIRDRPSRPLHTTGRHRSRGVPAERPRYGLPQGAAEPVSIRIQPLRSAVPGVAPLKPGTARDPQGSGGPGRGRAQRSPKVSPRPTRRPAPATTAGCTPR